MNKKVTVQTYNSIPISYNIPKLFDYEFQKHQHLY